MRAESTDSALTREADLGAVLRVPINHFEGNYTCSPETLAQLQAEEQIVLRYVDNPNGSMDDIAGICNEGRNVVGLHAPPRAGRERPPRPQDGVPLLRSLLLTAAALA
ncbi:MAG: phosphoribosylformylglycinamidine synthase subunit PurQ [Acidimicrobiales bacterium]